MNPHKHTILVIDDDVDDLSILHEAVREVDPGATVLTAYNGALGLERLGQLKAEGVLPCLIVLDVNMPVMDGRKTYDAIREDQQLQGIPLVVFSTSQSPLDKAYFEQRKAEYITKPVQFNQLLEVARRFLDICKL